MEKNSINNHQHQHRNRERIGVLGQVGDHHDDALLRTTTTTQTPETRSSDFVLQWGNRKRLRCMKIQVKVNNNTDSSSAAVPVHRTTVRVDRRVIRSDTNNNNNRETSSNHPSTTASNGYLNLRQRPPSPAHRILRNSESLIAMKGQSNGVKGVTSPDRGGAQDKRGSVLHNNSNNNITVATTTTNNNNNDNNGGRGGGSGAWEGAQDSKRGGNSSGSDGMPVVWPPKFVIGLTNKEKEEDFFAFKGSKLPQRPKKRAKFIQRTLNKPLRVSRLPKEIIKVFVGYHHSSAITGDGELYMWGKNSNGQLGLGKKAAKVVTTPRKVECLTGVTIKMAALGCEHSIAVTDKGEALSWGGGGSGRLGHGHERSMLGFLMSTSEYTPRLIKKLEDVKVKSIAAGMLHSACIDENGSVFIFGEKAVDKLGQQAKNATTPSMISQLPFSEEVACGGYHTCVLTSGGELYTWGSNENGCLGIGCTDVSHLPERVQGPFLKHPVFQVSCGWKHTAAISEGNVYAWGWGGSHGTFSEDGYSSGGQLGQGNDVDYIEPTWINFGKNVKALQVSCGFNHTGAILEYT